MITLEQLREAWMVISPPNYIERYATMKKEDRCSFTPATIRRFPLRFSEQVIEKARELGLDHKAVVMPCGHYTLG